jgi:hypothetical protein
MAKSTHEITRASFVAKGMQKKNGLGFQAVTLNAFL